MQNSSATFSEAAEPITCQVYADFTGIVWRLLSQWI